MAEYYPLLAKAVGSLPNSTPESRRVVYERARKALIGQLRTLHPPVPDEDIDRESLELDRAVARLEAELASGALPAPPAAVTQASGLALPAGGASALSVPQPGPARPASVLPAGTRERALPPLRTKSPVTRAASPPGAALSAASLAGPERQEARAEAARRHEAVPTIEDDRSPGHAPGPRAEAEAPEGRAPRREGQRPIAPLPPVQRTAKRRSWILPVAVIVLVVAGVAVAAWKLRDRRTVLAKSRPNAEQQQVDGGKIAERVGGPAPNETDTGSSTASPASPAVKPPAATPSSAGTSVQSSAGPASTSASGAEANLPVAQRAALLVEAPQEQNKVKTFLGHVVWKLNNVAGGGPSDAVGLAVEADIDIPDDKMHVVVTFEKNTDASLPASHTIKVRFAMQPGSFTGDIQKISVPQMRPEAVATGEPLVGVTVPVVTNSFLVGLAPGSAEANNLKLLKDLQWVDIPMLLADGKIAKLTFEKGAAGQRDFDEALAAWQK